MIRLVRSLKTLKKPGQYLGLILLVCGLIFSCNSDQNSRPVARTNQEPITIGTTLKPRTLDPADSYEVSGSWLIYNLSDRLYTYEPGTTQLKPQLATAMPTLRADGLTYTIPLRQGVIFHDGTRFNAEAMAFSLQRFIRNGGKPSFLLAEIVDSVQATGEYELTIVLKKPFAAFPALLAFPGACAVSPQAYKIGVNEFRPTQFVGTGPYKLAALDSDGVRLDVFEEYWGQKPANRGINVQIYHNNAANLFNSFQTQAVDIAYLSLDPDQIQELIAGASQDRWQAIVASGITVNYLILNLNQEQLQQRELRQAIAALIDRPLLIDRALRGQGEPLYSLIPTTLAAYRPVFRDTYGDGNINRAKQLLRQAGYSTANPARIELWYPVGSPVRNLVATTLRAWAAQQLDGMIQFVPSSIDAATAFSNLPQGIYPTFLIGWYPDFLDADNYIQPFLSCVQGSEDQGCREGGAKTQGSFYWNEQVNQLIDRQRREHDPETRQQLLSQIQELLAQDVPYIPLWQNKDYVFAQKGLNGVMINPDQNFPFWLIEQETER